MADYLIDDFEDGDIAGWSGETTYLDNTANGFLEGSREGRLTVDSNIRSVDSPALGGVTPPKIQIEVRIGTQTGNQYDNNHVYFYDTAGTGENINFRQDGTVLWNGSQISTWAADTSYTVVIYPDWSAGSCDISINGSSVATGVNWPLADFDYVNPKGDNSNSGSTTYFYVDNIYGEKVEAPSSLSASVTADDIDLSWNGTPDAGGYNIYRAQSSGSTLADYTQVASVGSTTTSYTDANLADGERYYYRVSATETYNGTTYESDGSNEADSRTMLPEPSAVGVTVSGDQFDVSWTNNSDNGNPHVYVRRWPDRGGVAELVNYHFRDGGNTTIADRSGNNNDAEKQAGAYEGAGGQLHNGGGYASIDHAYTTAGQSAFTIIVRFSSSANGTIAGFDRSEYWRLSLVNGAVRLSYYNDSDATVYDLDSTTTTFTDGTEHVAIVRFDAGAVEMWVDGASEGSWNHGATFGSGATRYGFLFDDSEAASYNGSRNGLNPIDTLNEVVVLDGALPASYVDDWSNFWWSDDSGALAASATSYTTTNLLDGEKYNVAVQTETAHVKARDQS